MGRQTQTRSWLARKMAFKQSNSLSSYVNTSISIITSDGRHILGTLKGFDQATNLILEGSKERVYSTDEGVEELDLGLYLMRGDCIAVVGENDEELADKIDISQVKGQPLNEVQHGKKERKKKRKK